VKVERAREDVYAITATRVEIGALVAAARLAVQVMRADPQAPPQAIALVEDVLAQWDAALAREAEEA
jgi:hypothetical protein